MNKILFLKILPATLLFLWSGAVCLGETTAGIPSPLERTFIQDDIPEQFIPLLGAQTFSEAERLTAERLYVSARMMESRGKVDAALRNYQRAWRCDSQDSILRNIVTLLVERKKTGELARYFSKLKHPEKLDVLVLRRVAVQLTLQNRWGEAIRAYQASMKALPADALPAARVFLRLELARLAYLNGDYVLSADCFEHVRRAMENPARYELNAPMSEILSENPVETWLMMADAYLLAQRPDSAELFFHKAEEKELLSVREKKDLDAEKKIRVTYDFHRARVAFCRKQYHQCEKLLKESLENHLRDEGSGPFLLLDELYTQIKKEDQLISELERLYKLDAENVQLGYFLASKLLLSSRNHLTSPEGMTQLLRAKKLYELLSRTTPTLDGYSSLLEISVYRDDPQEFYMVIAQIIMQMESFSMITDVLENVHRNVAARSDDLTRNNAIKEKERETQKNESDAPLGSRDVAEDTSGDMAGDTSRDIDVDVRYQTEEKLARHKENVIRGDDQDVASENVNREKAWYALAQRAYEFGKTLELEHAGPVSEEMLALCLANVYLAQELDKAVEASKWFILAARTGEEKKLQSESEEKDSSAKKSNKEKVSTLRVADMICLERGNALMLRKRYAEAIQVLCFAWTQLQKDEKSGGAVLHLDSKKQEQKAAVLYYLCAAYTLDGQILEGIRTATEAIQLRPDDAQFRARLAWVYFMGKREEKALEMYRGILERFGGDYTDENVREIVAQTRTVLSSLESRLGNAQLAEELLQCVLDEYPDDAGAHNDLAYIWAAGGKNLERAVCMAQYAISQDNKNSAYYDTLGWIYFHQGRYEDARRELENASRYEADAVVWSHLGEVYSVMNNSDGAIRCWKKSLEVFTEYDKDKITYDVRDLEHVKKRLGLFRE